MKLLLAAPLLFVAACDYAKPTDVEKVDDRVTALEERLDAENKAQDDRISSLQAHADSVSTEVASQVLQLRAQLDSLVESGELASSRIDSLLRALGMAEIESALAYVEGILDTDVDYGGELLANGGPIRGRGRDHLLLT